MEQTILRRLRADIGSMTAAERKIAELILRDPHRIMTLSLTEFAEEAEVSQGSIINFSKKYAEGGFPTLKLHLAASPTENSPKFTAVTDSDTPHDILKSSMRDAEQALGNTVAVNSNETLQRVIDRILQAKKVEIYGVYRSAVVATDFYYQLLTLGIPAVFVSDVLTAAVSASLLDAESLVVAVSASGKTKDVLDAVKIAKSRGVPVLSITNHKTSPLAALSDEVLVASASENTLMGLASEIRLSQLALTDALCAYLRTRIDEQREQQYFELREIISSHSVND